MMSAKISVRDFESDLPSLFKQGMRRLAGACTIITSAEPGKGRDGWAGLTATAVSSVTADPPQLLVCINRQVWAHSVITSSRVLGINILAAEDGVAHAKRFGGGQAAAEEKFAADDWIESDSGLPVLASALAIFECQVNQHLLASTHDIFICDVLNVSLREDCGNPLIYFNGAFSSESRAF